MCLQTIKAIPLKKDRYGTYAAYKVVFPPESGWPDGYGVQTVDLHYHLYPERWHIDDSKIVIDSGLGTNSISRYPSGFHAFITKEGAEHWRDLSIVTRVKALVVKVRVCKIVTTGIQVLAGVVVAKEIYLPKNWRKNV